MYFMDLLAKIVRDEIAGCTEEAFDYLSIKDARKTLLFTSDQELFEYIKEEHPEQALFYIHSLFFLNKLTSKTQLEPEEDLDTESSDDDNERIAKQPVYFFSHEVTPGSESSYSGTAEEGT